MDIKYLYNIINLYLKNEKNDCKTNLNIRKKDEKIVFNFNMNENDLEKTTIVLLYEDVVKELWNILNIYKQEKIIIKEEYKNNRYRIVFQNGRLLSFDGFTSLEINKLRNLLYSITINSNEIRLDELDNEKKMAYKPNYRLQETGFASYGTLLLVALYLTDTLLISLCVFKMIWK